MKIAHATISGALLGQLAADCRSRLPTETCGVMYGDIANEETLTIDGFAVIRNAAAATEAAFSFDPRDWVHAFYEAQKNRRNIVGYFHSHPNGTMLPSAADAEGWLPWGTYWIVGLTDDGHRIAGYALDAESETGWASLKLTLA